MDLTDIYRVFHPSAAQYIFFSAAHRTFCKLDHILGHKASLNKYKKIGITLYILSDHNGIKLECKSKKKPALLVFISVFVPVPCWFYCYCFVI
jgi:hypothetical protein